MKKLFWVLILFLISCNNQSNEAFILTVISKEGIKIKPGNKVLIKQQPVGKVSAVGLNNQLDVYAKVIFDKEIPIPEDSRFVFTSEDIFTRCIEIVPGESKTFFKSGSQVYGSVTDEIPLDTLINTFTNALENAKPVRNQDSIVMELNELNKQLEELNSQL